MCAYIIGVEINRKSHITNHDEQKSEEENTKYVKVNFIFLGSHKSDRIRCVIQNRKYTSFGLDSQVNCRSQIMLTLHIRYLSYLKQSFWYRDKRTYDIKIKNAKRFLQTG